MCTRFDHIQNICIPEIQKVSLIKKKWINGLKNQTVERSASDSDHRLCSAEQPPSPVRECRAAEKCTYPMRVLPLKEGSRDRTCSARKTDHLILTKDKNKIKNKFLKSAWLHTFMQLLIAGS